MYSDLVFPRSSSPRQTRTPTFRSRVRATVGGAWSFNSNFLFPTFRQDFPRKRGITTKQSTNNPCRERNDRACSVSIFEIIGEFARILWIRPMDTATTHVSIDVSTTVAIGDRCARVPRRGARDLISRLLGRRRRSRNPWRVRLVSRLTFLVAAGIGVLVPQREISPLVATGQADVPQRPIVQISEFPPRICAVLPCGKGGFHLLPNPKRFEVRFAHGSLLRPENNCNANLLCGWAIAVMHNTKLRFSIRYRCCGPISDMTPLYAATEFV